MAAKNKGADQTEWISRLICTFVVCIWYNGVNRFPHDVAHIMIDDMGHNTTKPTK